MDMMTETKYWEQKFGLYPVLIDPKNNKNRFLLLNGGSKDFCLQTNPSSNDDFFSASWSTNTKNFVVFDKEFVQVHNWLNGKIDKHPKRKVDGTPDKFYEYLSSQSPKTPDDAVPFIIGIFRALRNCIGKQKPEDALNLLFRLLISIDKSENDTEIDASKWGIAGGISVPHRFVEQIRLGIRSIAPNRDLLLRHVSGALFQEAHKEIVYFDHQMNLFGGFSDKLVTKNVPYSGVHYTPSYLARTIVENCLKQLDLQNKTHIKIFDPACGSSEFLIETLKQLQNRHYSGNVTVIGWDTSPSAVCTSKFLLKYEQQTQWNTDRLKFEIKLVDNSLTEQWDNDYDLIVMNPPFVSWELLKDKNSRSAILEALGSAFEGKPNLAAAFFCQAAKSLQTGGMLGCILPTTIFTSDSYSKLRNKIRERFSLNLLAKLGNYVFGSALTDVSFFIGGKTSSKSPTKLLWCKNEKEIVQEVLLDLRKMEHANRVVVEEKKYSIYTPCCFPTIPNSWKIISFKEEKFLNDIGQFIDSKLLTTISDVFDVKQGIRQGRKDIFKIMKKDYNSLSAKEKNCFRPVVDNDAVKSGQLSDSKYIWYPYEQAGIMFKSEKEMSSINFFKSNIKPYESDLKKRAGIQEWWGHTRPRTWQFEKQIKLISTEFGDATSFAIDKIGNFVVERGCAWFPKKSFETNDYYFYLSVFSSEIFNFLLSIYSKQILSGFYLGKVYTKDIPIPNVHLPEIRLSEEYHRLVELGKELANGNPYVRHAIGDVVKFYYPNI